MIMVSKLEINIRTLITQCEDLSKDEANFWRLKKFIKSLDTMIHELNETEESTPKNLSEYHSRVEKLKVITNYVENPPGSKKLKSKQVTHGDEVLKEINQLSDAKYYSSLRKELMGDENLRQRNVQTDEKGMARAMKYYSDTQEKIAEDMLSLTRNLREQTETASKIIKRDTELVTKSTNLSENNIGSLSKEAEKLQEHSRKAWKCWMWIMFGLVVMIFISMVLFMKIMKKKAS